MKIVRATKEHKDDYTETHNKSMQECYIDFAPSQWIQELVCNPPESFTFDKLLTNESIEIHICYDRNMPIGTIVLEKLGSEGEIHSIHFVKSAQGKGHAQTALEFAEDTLKRKGCTKIVLECLQENKRATNFYLKNGYKATSEKKTTMRAGKVFTQIKYEKEHGLKKMP